MNENQLNSRIMNDYEVMTILANLSIKERCHLISVSKQFGECIERLNRSQKVLRIRLKSLERRRRHLFDEDIVISERMVNSLNRIVDINIEEVKNKWQPLLEKFENLEKIEFFLNTISEDVFEWINNLFPALKSISIQIIATSDWTANKLKAIDSSFGNKCHSIRVKRFRQFERLVSAEIFQMSSLRSITLSVTPSEESLQEFLIQIPPTVSVLAIDNLIYSTNSQILSAFPKTNQIRKLKISFSNNFDGNYLLRYFCKNLPQIKDLYIIVGSINSLEVIRSAQHLMYLTLYPMTMSVIDVGLTPILISSQIKRLKFYGSYQLENKFIESLDTSFPMTQQLVLDNLKIYCDCDNRLKVCFICYKKLFEDCSQLIHRSMAQNKCFQMELVIENSEPYHQIVLMSMFSLYFNSNQSFKMIVKTYRTEYVSVVLLETANNMALKTPDLTINFIVNKRMSYDLENMSNILSPNLRLMFVDYEYESIPKQNEKFIFLELNSKKDKVWVYLGKSTSFSKRLNAYMYL